LELQHLKEEQLEGSHKSRMNLNSQDAARDLIADITSTLTHRSTRIQQTPLVKSPPNYGQLGKLSAHSDELPATPNTVQQVEQGEQERQVRNKHTYTLATTCSQRTPVWVCVCVCGREGVKESHEHDLRTSVSPADYICTLQRFRAALILRTFLQMVSSGR
jgi:hypothetical protein